MNLFPSQKLCMNVWKWKSETGLKNWSNANIQQYFRSPILLIDFWLSKTFRKHFNSNCQSCDTLILWNWWETVSNRSMSSHTIIMRQFPTYITNLIHANMNIRDVIPTKTIKGGYDPKEKSSRNLKAEDGFVHRYF